MFKVKTSIAIMPHAKGRSVFAALEQKHGALCRQINLLPGTEEQHKNVKAFAKNFFLTNAKVPSIEELKKSFSIFKKQKVKIGWCYGSGCN